MNEILVKTSGKVFAAAKKVKHTPFCIRVLHSAFTKEILKVNESKIELECKR